MSFTSTTNQEFLANYPPFNLLPEVAIADFAEKLKPIRYRMGQVIVRREQMPAYSVILYKGQARNLGYERRTRRLVTLQLLEPGAIIGWVNFVRGVPCETAIASTEVVGLLLKHQDLLQLIKRYPQIEAVLQDYCTLVEVFELLSYQLNQRALAEIALKPLATKALRESQVYYLPPGESLNVEHPTLQDSERAWLVSGGGEIVNFSIGSRLTLIPFQHIEVKGSESARLIGVSASILRHLKQASETPSPPSEVLLTPYADTELIEEYEFSAFPPSTPLKKFYPYVQGKTPLEAGVACFQMLSQYFEIPFRQEIIQRTLAEQIQRHESLSLDLCGAIAELMGLNTQLAIISADVLTRINAPVLVRWQDGLAILYEISQRQLVIGVPEIGILERKPADFLETWGEEGEVLLLQKTQETPQERFGLRWFLPALKRYRSVLIVVFVASFFVQLFALANPLMVQIIIDRVIVQNSVDTLQVLGIFLVMIAVFEALLATIRTYLFVDTTNRIDISLGSEIIDRLLRLPLRYFERRPVGDISTRVNELEKIRSFLTGTALTVVLDAVFSIIYIVVMVIYSPLLTLVALGIIPVFIVMALIFSPTIRSQLRTKAEENAQTQSYLVEVMSGIQTVKAQNIELRSRWQWQQRYARYVRAGFDTVITSTLASSTSNFLNKLSGLLVLWVGAYLVLEGELTLGQLIAFRIIAGYVTSPTLRLTQLWQNFQETALSLERLADIVDTPQEAERDRQNIPMPSIKGAVKYENVSFRFKSGGPLQLNNVNLDFAPGTFVAVVGQSGAGKSTLTKLLSRLYEPESGRILIDGYDIGKVELYSLRRQIGVIPQETLLFNGTVQENIALTYPDATTQEIIEAAKVAAAHEFIMTLPNGYHSRVGERGASLSGGQRQRIAIARSVLQRPQILVLDEATSALDYETEQKVCLNLGKAFRDQTVFFITHRLNSIASADVIVVLDAGTAIEQGTHEELIALEGCYYDLYQKQESRL